MGGGPQRMARGRARVRWWEQTGVCQLGEARPTRRGGARGGSGGGTGRDVGGGRRTSAPDVGGRGRNPEHGGDGGDGSHGANATRGVPVHGRLRDGWVAHPATGRGQSGHGARHGEGGVGGVQGHRKDAGRGARGGGVSAGRGDGGDPPMSAHCAGWQRRRSRMGVWSEGGYWCWGTASESYRISRRCGGWGRRRPSGCGTGGA